MFKYTALYALVFFIAGSFAMAQTNIALGGMTVDTLAAVEVTSDSLELDQDTRTAVFSGNVVISQGDLRVTAGKVEAIYGADNSRIARLRASDRVTMVTLQEAAEAQKADYDLTTGLLELSGDVLLTQGASAISAARMTIDVTNGTATMDGRVSTVLQQGAN